MSQGRDKVEEEGGENISEGTYANNDNIFDDVRHIFCWSFGILSVGQVVSQLFIKSDSLKKEEEEGCWLRDQECIEIVNREEL